ncbi:hypothetical protein ACFVSN_43265 [Kitasatospora sp. NPDC057904]|uniref:hypothetical protein n=1 Tax=Kitasatospora sp. NPDC057904 TaxID=3346275 RepID=UPI0036DB2305
MAAVTSETMLSGWTGPVDITQVINPGESQSVLARIHAAAIANGPLLIYLCGQVTRDRLHGQLHIVLTKTTGGTRRYTELPWHWISLELTQRRPNTTTVIVDLLADASCFPLRPTDLQLPPHTAQWGVVHPPRGRYARETTPVYSTALARLMAAPGGSHLAQLHAMAIETAKLGSGTVVLGGNAYPVQSADRGAPPPAPPAPRMTTGLVRPAAPGLETNVRPTEPALRSAINHAVHAGNYGAAAQMAAQWEQQVVRDHGRQGSWMVEVLETQAVIAAASGDTTRATQLWIKAARQRAVWLPQGSGPRQEALQNAQASWFRLDASWPQSKPLGSDLAAVLLEAGQAQAAAAVEQRLATM